MDIIEIAKKIKNAGGNLYLVGGAIRDEIIGVENHDKDYCVTGISKDTFIKLFPKAHLRGKAFEVFDIERTEFALARVEKKSGIGHKEFSIQTGENITIEQDLARRDITINAIAKDVLTGEIIDPHLGIKDIQNKTIRATTKAFCEDPLRVYRVARISAQTGFKVDKSTIELMYSLKSELNTLSKERVFTEFKKALETNKPSIFFEVLKQANVLDIHFKEIYDLIGALQPIKYHPEGDSYNHTMIVLDEASKLTKKLEIRFSALVHDLGKGVTPKEMYPHHYGHEQKGVEVVAKFGKRIGAPKNWISCGKVAASEHMRGGMFYKMSIPKRVDFIERVSKSKLGLEGLQIVVKADRCDRGDIKEENTDFETIAKQCIQEINGEYIKQKYNIEEGVNFGKRLHDERIKWMKQREKL